MINPHIEVINQNLWAVRFCFLQYIKDIEYEPDPTIPTDEEPLRISKEGIMVLNKDHKVYPFIRKFLPELMSKSTKQLIKELDKCALIENKQLEEHLYRLTILLEIQRRNELKKVG